MQDFNTSAFTAVKDITLNDAEEKNNVAMLS